MKSTVIKLTLMVTLTAMVLACGNNRNNTKQKVQADTTGKTMTKVETQPDATPKVPFAVVIVQHSVADYNKWKTVYDADSTNRKAAGLHPIGLSRGLDDPNLVEVPFMIDDVQKAKAFVANPKLKDAMQEGGVTSKPDILFVNVLRMSKEIVKPGEFVEVRHKVKDFDSWLKAYDGEGEAKRANDGLEDGVLARGMDDPNMVLLVFKITDKEKAKTAMNDPARQKLMQEAGVVGKPEVYFGKDQ